MHLRAATRFWGPGYERVADQGGASGSAAFVAMMDSADFWERDNLALGGWLDSPRPRGIFVQTQVRAPVVIIRKVVFEEVVQMRTVEHNDMIQTFTSDRTDETFYVRGLPGRTGCNPEVLELKSLGDMLEF